MSAIRAVGGGSRAGVTYSPEMAAGIRARVEQSIKASLEDPEIRQLVAFRRAKKTASL